jgi:hypothetical protein
MKHGNLRQLSVIGRTVTALLVGASMLVGTMASPSHVAADDVLVRDHRAKDAWLEVVVNKIIIHDDEDGFLKGSGEFNFQVRIGTLSCDNGPIWGDCLGQLVKSANISFSADSGQTVTLNRVVPRLGDLLSTSLDDDAGVTVHPGTTYGIEVSGSESDVGTDDAMGWTHLVLNDSSDWAIGTHMIRGRQPRGFTFSGLLEDISCAVVDCASQSGWAAASYSVELEVRRVALADLTPRSIKVVNRSTERPERQWKEICAMVANIGPKETAGYDVNFTLDGAPYTRSFGYTYPGELDEVCAEVPDPALGEHVLTASIEGVPEMDLSNNEMRSTYTRTVLDDIRADVLQGGVLETATKTEDGPSSGPSQTTSGPISKEPVVASGPVDINLAVTGIRVKGGCEEGKNDVMVTVKNQGTATVRDLIVNLQVNGGDDKDKSLGSLDAGNDATVEFGDVQLKKGDRKLTASVAPKGSDKVIAEDTETINCKD